MALHTLPGSFCLLQAIGLWKPQRRTLPWLYRFYPLYAIITFFMIHSFMLTELIELIVSHNDMSEFTNNAFMLLTIVADCGKTVNVLVSRKSIVRILEILENDPCLPRDHAETIIQSKCDRTMWIHTLLYGILVNGTGVVLLLGVFIRDVPPGTLPVKAWLPYNYTEGCIYWFTFVHQSVSCLLSATAAIAYDTLLAGLLLQISTKFNILKYRLSNFTEILKKKLINQSGHIDKLKMEKLMIMDCVKYHLIIFKLAKCVNSTFSGVIFLQYFFSTVVLCISIYNISSLPLFSTEFNGIVLYLCCILIQIFIFCLRGNEATLLSGSISDAIYETDWMKLNNSTVKSLIVIMNRTHHPIRFTSLYFVTLSFESFKSLIKGSYSTYNLLQRSST